MIDTIRHSSLEVFNYGTGVLVFLVLSCLLCGTSRRGKAHTVWKRRSAEIIDDSPRRETSSHDRFPSKHLLYRITYAIDDLFQFLKCVHAWSLRELMTWEEIRLVMSFRLQDPFHSHSIGFPVATISRNMTNIYIYYIICNT